MSSPDMENIVKDFESVKAFVVSQRPEFENVVLHFCDEATEIYRESAQEQAQRDKPPRTYAHTLHYPNTVCITPMAGELTSGQRQGIFIHEFGHLFCDRHPYYEGIDNPLDKMEDGDADYVVITVFGVHLHYGDEDEIQYIKLPIGSEPIPPEDPDEKDIEEIEEEEEHDEYGLGLPTSGDLAPSLEAEVMTEQEAREIAKGDAPVIDLEPEND